VKTSSRQVVGTQSGKTRSGVIHAVIVGAVAKAHSPAAVRHVGGLADIPPQQIRAMVMTMALIRKRVAGAGFEPATSGL
jgi:hypothetical protein